MSTLAKISSSISGINTAKLTSSLSDSLSSVVKKIDTSAITTSLKKTTSGITSSATTAVKKTGEDIGTSLKKFDSFPAPASTVKRVTGFISENPKLALAGVSVASAAGFVAFQMANGLSLDEALAELSDLVGDVVEEVVDTTTSFAGGLISQTTQGLLKGILGENYMLYVYTFAVILFIIIAAKIRNLFRK